jgi:hypothetical protein
MSYGEAMILEDLERRYDELHKRIELVRSYL